MRACAVGDISGCPIDPQQPPVEIDRDMMLAADDLLAGVPENVGQRSYRIREVFSELRYIVAALHC